MNDTPDGLGVLLEALTDTRNYELRWDLAKGELHLRRVRQPEHPQRKSGEIRHHLLLAEESVIPKDDRKVLAGREPGDYRWPIGEPSDTDSTSAGAPKPPGCSRHTLWRGWASKES